ncbi:MAG: hypothetical protein ACK5RG_13570 [Cyclobacteriaceae bacterium]|jgi:hypothetical protein|nr:hypothetical protein [Flammeovirgaceae bacterium]
MKSVLVILVITCCTFYTSFGQEQYGKTINLGLGIGGRSGYYSYVGRSIPVFAFNYELNVAKDFTLAPFISFYSFSNDYPDNGNNYVYRESVIPIGVKGFYYFDDLLNATGKWDFYLAGSLGFAIINSTWDVGYSGNRNYYGSPSTLFLDIHIGSEYHFNSRIGAFLDLSTGVSTIGLAIHSLK